MLDQSYTLCILNAYIGNCVNIGEEIVIIMAYADHIVLLAENEDLNSYWQLKNVLCENMVR